ncbi:MAG: amino acid adenylation domain-containing protein [Pseudonocardiaceae bacterium]
MAGPDVTVEEIRQTVANLVEEDSESIGPDTNLFELGLDSIVLMRLVGRWRRSGIEVNFAELAENPTIGAWSRLMCERELVAVIDTEAGADAHVEFPLAVMQHAYWIGRGDGPWLGGVAAHLYTEFDGVGVDPDRLQSAIERLITRHDMLRARFTPNGQQRIETASGWRGLTVHRLRDLDPQQSAARLESIRDTFSHQMLDIERGEVFCTALSLLPDGRTRLHLDVDMVAADAVSYRILLADLARLYEQPDVALPAVHYSYREYRMAVVQSRSEAARWDAEWWHARLPGLPGAPELPLAAASKVSPAAGSNSSLVAGSHLGQRSGPARVSRRYFMLPAHARAALTSASRRRGLTPAMVVATAFAEVVGAWSVAPRFLLNVPLFTREQLHPDIDQLVGDFTGSVLLEVDLTEPVEFVERVRRVQSQLHADAAHAGYSGVEVLRDLTRHRGEQVFAPVVFTSALSLGELFDAGVRRSFGDPVWIISQNPQVLLDIQITELGGGLLVNWDVREQEFADGVVDAMFAAFQQLVHRLLDDDTTWQVPVDDLLPLHQRRVRERVNATAVPRPDRLLHEGFFAIGRQVPAAGALLWGERGAMSYGELADRALRVAGALRAHGVAPGDPVGVTLPKGPDQVVAVLGVLAAGGVYVPVGVDQPALRRERILRTAGARVVVDETTLAASRCATALDAPVMRSPDEPAYVIFTSGSTGEPKGVEVSHRAAMNTIDDINFRYRIGVADRVLAVSALDFDLSVYDIFGLLSAGGAVVCIGEDQRRDAAAWTELVARHRVTIWNTVPQLLDMLCTAAGAETVVGLRVALVSGDWVGLDLSARVSAAAPGCRVVALGGATEAAIWSNAIDVPAEIPASWTSVPYGFPLANQCYRVVDACGRDCPDWVAGELWIGGAGVARGYRGDPQRTADRFAVHAGQRWYRTGDHGRYWPDGTLEFLGRRDAQLKIRGQRTELGEIEAALETHPGIGRAVVAVLGKPGTTLVAAVTTRPGRVVATPQWCAALDRVLRAPQQIEPVAWPTADAEAELVEALLTQLLSRRCAITDRPRSLELLAASSGVADDQLAVLRLWSSWLAERKVLTVDDGGIAAGTRLSLVAEPGRWPRLVTQVAGTPLAAVAARLADRADDLFAMLCGDLDALTLLEDPVLAPEALIHISPATTVALSELTDALNDLAHSLDRRLRIVELGARTGRTAVRLLERLPPERVDYTVTDTSAQLLAQAKQRLANQPHQLRFHRLSGDVVPEHLHRHCDVLLADNSLHAFNQVASGLALAAELLTPQGVLLALEQVELSPLAMIAAVLPTRGFSTLDNDRRQRGTPLLTKQQWCRLLAEHGFERVHSWYQGTSALVQLRACLAAGGNPIRTAEVRDWIAERLPAHMIPNRLVVLPRLPLSANDKVDRARVRWLLERDIEPEPADRDPACGQVEEIVAATWAELLEIPAVSRTGNFFALGGDSMLLLKVQTSLAQRLRREVAIVDLYRYPTVASLAAHFGTAAVESGELDRVAARARRQRRARQGWKAVSSARRLIANAESDP